MKIISIGSVAVITPDLDKERQLFVEILGLPLVGDDDYYHSEQIAGSPSFGLWPLAEAAQACFGSPNWPAAHPVPQTSIEFEVADADAVGPAAAELAAQGFPLLHEARVEPWGQTVARVLSPAGVIIGISYAPALHNP